MDKQSNENTLKLLKKQGKKPVEQQTAPDCSRYGIPAANLLALLKRLKGRCPLCGKKWYLVLNYNHETKKARGYICRGCNNRLAGLDDKVFMAAAVKYLDNPPLEQFYK